MAGKSKKSFEDFKAAALELTGEGRSVTFAGIREKLGGGSFELLKGYMAQWEASKVKAVAGHVPEKVADGVHTWYAELVVEAKKAAEAQLATREAAVGKREEESKEKEIELRRREERLEGKEEVWSAQLEQAKSKEAWAEARVQELTVELAETRQKMLAGEVSLRMEREARESMERLAKAEMESTRELVSQISERTMQEVDRLRGKLMEGVDGLQEARKSMKQEIGGVAEASEAAGERAKEGVTMLSLSIAKVEKMMSRVSERIEEVSKGSDQGISALRDSWKAMSDSVSQSVSDSVKAGEDRDAKAEKMAVDLMKELKAMQKRLGMKGGQE